MNDQKTDSLTNKLQQTLLQKPDEKKVKNILNAGVLDSLFPEPDPLVDLKRIPRLLDVSSPEEFVSLVSAILASAKMSKSENFRSAKNIVLVLQYLRLSDEDRRALQGWVSLPEPARPTVSPIGRLSMNTCKNYLGYLGTLRFENNCLLIRILMSSWKQ